jgi:hypothetical protein
MFNSDILGSVADWFMVIVTTITAVYLYKTLQSQKEVQKTQNQLFEIESIRFRKSIQPTLKYEFKQDLMMLESEDEKMLSIQVTNETENMALDVEISFTPNQGVFRAGVVMGMPFTHIEKDGAPYFIHFHLDFKDRGPKFKFIVFAVTYQDIAGTKYKQGVLCIYESDRVEINPFLPEIIS